MTKIVIAVFDGLQPSQINSLDTPNLFNLSGEGSFFENHHPVFPSVTRVNAASMVTGVNPGKHWLAGNTFVARDYDDSNVMPALNDQLSKIRNSGLDVLGVPTLQEIISSKKTATKNERDETIKVCTNPIRIGKLKFFTTLPT